MQISSGFGSRVKQLREAMALSQLAMARGALSDGASAKNIGRIELEEVMPRLDTLTKIANFGGVPIQWLCTGSVGFQSNQQVKVAGLGGRLEKARKAAGLTPLALAKAAELGASSINVTRIEKGTSSPRLGTLERIAAQLNTPVALLIFGK